MRKLIVGAIGVLALSLGTASGAFAAQWTAGAHIGAQVAARSFAATGPAAAPEIDPASALSGLTLLLGGLAVVRGRRLKK